MPAANTGRMALPFEKTLLPQVIRIHDAVYQKTNGWIGHRLLGIPSLLLHTVGAKTGKPRSASLTYARDGDDYLIVASKGGAPEHPGWYENLAKDPNVELQVKGDVFPAHARTAEGEERDRLWKLAAQQWPDYDNYQASTDREIPVVILELG